MIEVRTIEAAGFAAAFEALRLPFGKECRSETHVGLHNHYNTEGWHYANTLTNTKIHPQDMTLMQALVKRGDEHAKVVRGIMVWAEINAPRYWWQEMDTYRIGTDRLSSESTMHIQGKGMTTEELVKMKEELTEGTMQKRVQVFSYQALRRIYFQRKDHRLPHWQEFCRWIESLPFAEELITTR